METRAYTTKLALREESGLIGNHKSDRLVGVTNGLNRVFVAEYRPLVDMNGDEIVNKSDVTLYVDGLPVAVTSVDAITGAITATVAPATGTDVTADYSTSPISDNRAASLVIEVSNWVDTKVGKYVAAPLSYDTYPTVPGLVQTAARMFGAGLALIRDYGSSADTDETSKDGYKRIAQAEKLLDTFIANLEDTVDNSADNRISATSDGFPFGRGSENFRGEQIGSPFNAEDRSFWNGSDNC